MLKKSGNTKELKKLKKFFVPFVILFVIVLSILTFKIFFLDKRECITDSDCVKQRTTCCSCSMGGKEMCMSKKNASYWRETLVEECKDIGMCIALYNCEETGCLCQSGKCVEE